MHDLAEEAVSYRRLAMRVIERALKDLARPECGGEDRETAREFLAGSPMLLHWCRVATLDPRRVIASAVAVERRQRRLEASRASERADRLGVRRTASARARHST
jgi:hypothetical protein